jgi:hypothetical protein
VERLTHLHRVQRREYDFAWDAAPMKAAACMMAVSEEKHCRFEDMSAAVRVVGVDVGTAARRQHATRHLAPMDR